LSTLREIARLVAEGNNASDVVEYLVVEHKIAEDDARGLLEQAAETLRDEVQFARDVDWHVAARLDVYRKMLAMGDYPAALRCLQDLAKLDRLYDKPATGETVEIDGEKWYSTRRDIAAAIGVSIRTVSRYVADGKIERCQIDGETRYRQVDRVADVKPVETREEAAAQLADVAAGVLGGKIDPRVGNSVGVLLKTAAGSLPKGRSEKTIEDLAEELPDDDRALAEIAKKYFD